MKKKASFIALLFFTFYLYYAFRKTGFAAVYKGIQETINIYGLSYALSYIIVASPIIFFVAIQERKNFFGSLGLMKNPFKPFLVASIFSIPMFIGYGYLSNFEVTLSLKDLLISCVFAAFFEEVIHRGFFFGNLFKKLNLGFIPSLLISATVFASFHLYQSENLNTLIGIFATTFLGSILFAWLYIEWRYNIWISISLHLLMNLSWNMFAISDNALGNTNANIVRLITVFLSIGLTVVYKYKNKIQLEINRTNLFSGVKEIQ